jgi:glycosyltransferase involved in cell wall biosynthesis
MNVTMFSSWQVPCGIADYSGQLVNALDRIDDTHVSVVPFDRRSHPRAHYVRWGQRMNDGDVAHIQHEYTFFGYRTPWSNHFRAFAEQIRVPLVITRHVSFDGPLRVSGRGLQSAAWRAKWSLYNRWLGAYARRLNKDTFDVARRIIVLSGRLKDHLIARGVAPDKIHVIPAGASEVTQAARDEACVRGRDLRTSWGWTNKTVVCLFGFIAPAKGHLLALQALSQLPDDFVLLIAGGARLASQSSFVKELMRQVTARNMQDRVRVTGYLSEPDVASHIAASDVLIFPATHADFSYSVVTGLAHQMAPALASDLYSHREIALFCPGLALFPAADSAALAREIRRITQSPDVRRRMIAAQAVFAHGYSWDAIAARTREVYELAIRG